MLECDITLLLMISLWIPMGCGINKRWKPDAQHECRLFRYIYDLYICVFFWFYCSNVSNENQRVKFFGSTLLKSIHSQIMLWNLSLPLSLWNSYIHDDFYRWKGSFIDDLPISRYHRFIALLIRWFFFFFLPVVCVYILLYTFNSRWNGFSRNVSLNKTFHWII